MVEGVGYRLIYNERERKKNSLEFLSTKNRTPPFDVDEGTTGLKLQSEKAYVATVLNCNPPFSHSKPVLIQEYFACFSP